MVTRGATSNICDPLPCINTPVPFLGRPASLQRRHCPRRWSPLLYVDTISRARVVNAESIGSIGFFHAW